jgi:hypothetical protein
MPRSVEAREKDYKALAMVQRGFTYRQIGAELGWSSTASVSLAVKRALKEISRVDPDEVVKLMRSRLDDYRRQAWRVLGTRHYVTSPSGAVARHPITGDPLVDDGPVLQALDRLLKYDIEERKMLGVDAPTRTRVQIITEDDVDQAIRELTEKHASMEARGLAELADADPGPA